MSHIVSIATEIKDIEAVKRACAELGLVFKENQTTCKFWHAQQHTCTHAIELPKGSLPYAMELGLVRQASGSYSLVGDELLRLGAEDEAYHEKGWPKRLVGTDTNPLGTNFNKLLQLYGVAKATIEAKKRGYLVTRSQVPGTNKIQLCVTGM
jgi:hypothetical protein